MNDKERCNCRKKMRNSQHSIKRFFFQWYGDHRDLHSFPTRRSSDLFLASFSVNAHQKLQKTSQTVKANKDVTLNLDTSYTNIEIDTWNKNEVKIEAYIESEELSKAELQDILESWEVEVTGSGANISISTGSDFNPNYNWNFNSEFDEDALRALEELQFVMADMPELPELPEGVHNVNFDFDTYKKEGEAYLEKWSKEYQEKYGKEYKDKMKAWAKEFSKTDFDKYSKEMEAWGKKFGESFGKDMEVWGEKFGENFGKEWEEKMEKHGKLLEEQLEKHEGNFFFNNVRNNKVIKTIKIKMPKGTKLKLNVRHGELKIVSVIHNLKADLSHSTLVVESINGSNTSINASYTPVLVTN